MGASQETRIRSVRGRTYAANAGEEPILTRQSVFPASSSKCVSGGNYRAPVPVDDQTPAVRAGADLFYPGPVVNLRLLLVPAAALLLVTAGCGREAGPSGPPAAKFGPSVQDLTVKAAALQADQCQTVDAATVYPECERYTTEVVNFGNSVVSETAGAKQADAIKAAVDKAQAAVADYEKRQCGVGTQNPGVNNATPSTSGPNAAPCAADLTIVRDQVDAIGKLLNQIG
jgi:hypothetical protein